MSRRIDRVNEHLRQEISKLLTTEMSDPRLSSVVSITHIDTSRDLSYAKVFISVLGNREAKSQSIRVLNSATGFLRRELGYRVSLRSVPELKFILDDTVEQGARLLEIIGEVAPKSDSGETL